MIAVLFAAACEKTLDYNRSDIQDQLMMNAQLSTMDSVHIVNLAISKDVTVSSITSGTVKCYVNGMFISEGKVVNGDEFLKNEADLSYVESVGTLNSNKPSEMCQTSFAFNGVFKPGDVVRIEATANGGQYKASSDVAVPVGPSAGISKAELEVETNSESVYHGDEIPKVTLKCVDNPSEKNYYRLTACYTVVDSLCRYEDSELVASEIQSSNGRFVILKGNNLILNDGVPSNNNSDLSLDSNNHYNVFSDYLMPSKSFDLSFGCGWEFSVRPILTDYTDCYSTIILRVCLTGISKVEYNHLKAIGLYDNQGNDITMSEPISFSDNVDGGVGVVSISTPTILTHTFPTKHYTASSK